jgi:hypothetical protein
LHKKKTSNEQPRGKPRGIEDFSLKYLRIRGNKSPAPPVRSAPRGGVLNPKRATPLIKKNTIFSFLFCNITIYTGVLFPVLRYFLIIMIILFTFFYSGAIIFLQPLSLQYKTEELPHTSFPTVKEGK